MDLQDTVVDRSLDRLLSYWYIFSCLVEIPPIAYLAIWYLNLSTYEILIFFLLFYILNAVLEVHNYGPHFLLTGVSFDMWQWVRIVH